MTEHEEETSEEVKRPLREDSGARPPRRGRGGGCTWQLPGADSRGRATQPRPAATCAWAAGGTPGPLGSCYRRQEHSAPATRRAPGTCRAAQRASEARHCRQEAGRRGHFPCDGDQARRPEQQTQGATELSAV